MLKSRGYLIAHSGVDNRSPENSWKPVEPPNGGTCSDSLGQFDCINVPQQCPLDGGHGAHRQGIGDGKSQPAGRPLGVGPSAWCDSGRKRHLDRWLRECCDGKHCNKTRLPLVIHVFHQSGVSHGYDWQRRLHCLHARALFFITTSYAPLFAGIVAQNPKKAMR